MTTITIRRTRTLRRAPEPAPAIVSPPAEQIHFWTVADAMRELGISDTTLRMWRRDGLPCFVRGQVVLFVPRDLERWIQSHYETPQIEPTPLRRTA